MDDAKTIAEDSHPQIKISIIVPVFNQVAYTKQCLEAIWKNTRRKDYEVIVVNDASTDETEGYLNSLNGRVRAVHNHENLGFIRNCNLAATMARGEYLVFLNNDTIPQTGWLDSLTEIVENDSRAAIVGAKMIWPDGTLLEAGSIVFNDGSPWNFGRTDTPNRPKYNHVRDVDYVSGGCMLVRKKVWDELGGFDTRYCPAYFDDIDLCFAARKAGYRVIYTPFCQIIHFEGVTGGRDIIQGVKRYQVINRKKFREKWVEELKIQYEPSRGNVLRASWRGTGKRVLWIDHCLPLPNFNSGSLRMNHLMKTMVRLGHKVTYAVLVGTDPGNYGVEMQKLGVETAWLGFESWQSMEKAKKDERIEKILDALEIEGKGYEIVYFSFYWVAAHFIDKVRKRLPDAIIYVDSHDIHYLRMQREAELYKDREHTLRAIQTKIDELNVYSNADSVLTVTEQDREVLLKELPSKPIFLMPNVHDVVPLERGFADRKNLLFVGGFNHTPNVDAMVYFCGDIFPKVKERLPGIKLWIVGSNPRNDVKSLANESVTVTGWVNETKPYLDACRISVAPIRYGAGMKGKIGEAMSHGLPVITTTVGGEGMGIRDGEHALVADSVEEWVEAIARLYSNEELWKRLSMNGQYLMSERYGSEAMQERAMKLLAFNSRSEVQSQAVGSPAVQDRDTQKSADSIKVEQKLSSIIILTYNQLDYTKLTIDSIRKRTKTRYEIIVVDNASTDGTVEYLKAQRDIRTIFNDNNLGFPAGCNQGMEIAKGDYAVLLNNDVIVTDGWLEGLIECAESDSSIGIVGPMTNWISGFQLERNITYKKVNQMPVFAANYRRKNRKKWIEVPRVAGFCMLIKREIINKIGGLETAFGLGNCEDDDYCLRAKLAGFKVALAGDVFIHHFGSKSFSKNGVAKYLEVVKLNENLFQEKWGVTPSEWWKEGKEPSRLPAMFLPLAASNESGSTNDGIAGNETEWDSLYHGARDLAIQGKIDEAVSSLEDLLKARPNHSGALNDIGALYFQKGEKDKAIQSFRNSVKAYPLNVDALRNLADLYLAAGRIEEAAITYKDILTIKPNDPEAIQRVGYICSMLGKSEDAEFFNSLVNHEA